MSRKIIYGFILLMVVTISCNVTNTSTEGAFEVRGTEGLSIKLRDDNIPDKIVVKNDKALKFVLEVANKGGYDVANPGGSANPDGIVGTLFLSGFDTNLISLSQTHLTKELYLEKISEFNPKGGSDVLEIALNIAASKIPEGVYDPKINFNYCYDYSTKASVSMCIDPDIYDETRSKKVCQVKTENLDSQGAPIAVKSVEPEIFSDSMLFRIKIKNVGGGEVVDSSQGFCASQLNNVDKKSFDLVHISSASISGVALECRPLIDGDHMRLINGVGEMECSAKLSEITGGSTTSFATPLTLEVKYVYQKSFEKQLNIVKVP